MVLGRAPLALGLLLVLLPFAAPELLPFAAPEDCKPGTVPAATASTCASCKPGRFSTRAGQLSCDKCPSGKYQRKRGASFCFTLRGHCPAGTYNSVLEGSTYIFTKQPCAACPAGKYGVSMPAQSNGDPYDSSGRTGAHDKLHICQSCPAGKYTPHAGLPGCSWCRKGRHQDWAGQAACLACARGKVAARTGRRKCARCKPGTYQLFIGQAACDPCEAGRASSAEGARFCAGCTAGQYGTDEGMPTCWYCPAGKFQPKRGETKCIGVVDMTQAPTPVPRESAAPLARETPLPPSAQLLGMPAAPTPAPGRAAPMQPPPPPPPPPPPAQKQQQQQQQHRHRAAPLGRAGQQRLPPPSAAPGAARGAGPSQQALAAAQGSSHRAPAPVPARPALTAGTTAIFVTVLLFAWGGAIAVWSVSNSKVQRMEAVQQFQEDHYQRDEDAVALINQVLRGAKTYSTTAATGQAEDAEAPAAAASAL
jgi:hypothetical protein